MAFQPVQGISADHVTNIPKEWSKEWFRGFIRNHMEQMDVRNAVAGPGIAISTAAAKDSHKLLARGKISAGTGGPIFTPTQSGSVPASGGGVLNFLRADATFSPVVTSLSLNDGSAIAIYTTSPTAVTTGPIAASITLKTQAANTVFAGPASGGAVQPTFRALVAADVPPSILPGGFSGFANPTGLIGMTAVNGVATTADRSDSTHAIDPAISPTWTGLHTFVPAGGIALIAGIVGAANNPRLFVRNVEASGLTTLDFTGSANFNGALAVGGVVVVSLSNAGNVTIAAPSSGTSLTIAALAGWVPLVVNSAASDTVQFNSTNASGVLTRYQNSAVDIGYVGSSKETLSPAGNLGDFSIVAHLGQLQFGVGAFRLAGTIATTGAWSIPATSAGGTFRIYGASGIDALYLDNSGSQFTTMYWFNNGNLRAEAYWDENNTTLRIGANSTNGITAFTSGSDTIRMSIAAAGNVTINAPASGDTLLVTNVAGANALVVKGNSAGTAVVRFNTQATTGAQTATFAATNKPGSGTTSPDTWLPVSVDGTTHYIPCFL